MFYHNPGKFYHNESSLTIESVADNSIVDKVHSTTGTEELMEPNTVTRLAIVLVYINSHKTMANLIATMSTSAWLPQPTRNWRLQSVCNSEADLWCRCLQIVVRGYYRE